MGRRSFFVALVCLLVFSAQGKNSAGCPNLSGNWICDLSINGEPEGAFTTYYKVAQKTLKDGETHYDIGGQELIARSDSDVQFEKFRSVCSVNSLVTRFEDEFGSELVETFTRPSPTKMRAEILRSKPEPFENNSVVYDCSLNGLETIAP